MLVRVRENTNIILQIYFIKQAKEARPYLHIYYLHKMEAQQQQYDRMPDFHVVIASTLIDTKALKL